MEKGPPPASTREQAERALEAARNYSRTVICEKFITGFDFRVLVINFKFVCAHYVHPHPLQGWHTYHSTTIDASNRIRAEDTDTKVLTRIGWTTSQ